ncbi:uncharacterized protein LOC133850176 [Drosophila sulfurigaster albostrigata]|uniref:uncharacterized protein LOC133850176 n=1 Tax=Drosophila sulfurigaster albostrigata TaxID=89887 RepID=UPI002D21B076|nr:uncharacterized protein LOC133850176 [Drosophila sulfurigaster albostrigata]
MFGIWYSHYRTTTQANQTLNCVRSHVREDVDDGLYIKTYYQFPKNNSIVIQRAKIYGLQSSGYFRTRKLVWKYEKLPRKYSEHWVIDTDYKTYRVSFNCMNLTSYGRVTGSQQILLLQTRTKFPTRGLIEKLKGIATKAGLSIEHAFKVDQRNCPLRF